MLSISKSGRAFCQGGANAFALRLAGLPLQNRGLRNFAMHLNFLAGWLFSG
jgi:hypothetical protein